MPNGPTGSFDTRNQPPDAKHHESTKITFHHYCQLQQLGPDAFIVHHIGQADHERL